MNDGALKEPSLKGGKVQDKSDNERNSESMFNSSNIDIELSLNDNKLNIEDKEENGSENDIKTKEVELLDVKMDLEDGAKLEGAADAKKNSKMPKTKMKKIEKKGKKKKGRSAVRCCVCRKTGKVSLTCKKCPRSFHMECLKLEEAPKAFYCDKCKVKIQAQKKRNKEKLAKKKEKEREKESQKMKQMNLETFMKANSLGGATSSLTKSDKKNKQKFEEKQKKLEEFFKRYDYYIVDGKIKFPIEDKILQIYGNAITDDPPLPYKPSPKSSFISSDVLGDLLQVWNFLSTFSEFLKTPELSLKGLFVCLNHKSSVPVEFINEINYSLVSVLMRDLVEKNKFDQFKEPNEPPFFFLMKYLHEMNLFEDLLPAIWTEFLRNIEVFSSLAEIEFSQAEIEAFENFKEINYVSFNSLDLKERLKIYLAVLNLIYELGTFQEHVNTKMEEYSNLTREKANLILEIKQEEGSMNELKVKMREYEEKEKNSQTTLFPVTSRQESIKKQKEAENEKKEYAKNLAAIAKIEAQISKKKTRVDKITHDLPFSLITSMFLGQDVNKTEYWLDSEIFVKYPKSPLSREVDTWYYLDSKEEIEQLMVALNTKGIREKNLYENLQFLRKQGYLNLVSKGKAQESEENKSSLDSSKIIDNSNSVQDELSLILNKILSYKKDSSAEEIGSSSSKTFRNKDRNSRDGRKYDLNTDYVKELIIETEEIFSLYLAQRNSRWCRTEDRENFANEIRRINDLHGLKTKLKDICNYFSVVAFLFISEENIPEEVAVEESETLKKKVAKERKAENSNDSDEEGSLGKMEEEDADAEKEQEAEEDDDEFYYRLEGDIMDKAKSSGNVNMAPQDQSLKADTNCPMENLKQLEASPNLKIKKIPLKLWGQFQDKTKRFWLSYLEKVDNLPSLLIASVVFCETIQLYVRKKMEFLMRGSENIRKQGAGTQSAPSFANQKPAKEKPNTIPAKPESQENYNYVSNNEKMRTKQEKLNELLYKRRSERTFTKKTNIFETLNEQQWDENCKICKDYGKMVCCDTCPSVFHPTCVGLKEIPEGSWSCWDCLEKFTIQRTTRSKAKIINPN